MSSIISLKSILRQAVTVVLVASALALSHGASQAAEPLVSPQWLKANLSDPSIVVLDVRSAIDGGGAEAYAKGHIPGAVHSDYDKAGWRVTRDNIPFSVPSVPELEKLIGEAGIDEDSYVIVVPAGVHVTDFGSAARVYWTLKLVGIEKVSILDGGYKAWAADPANPVETGARAASPKIFTATLNKSLFADVGDVESVVHNGGATLLDARPASFFLGKQKADKSKAYGHLPGAVNIDSASFYDPATNRLKSKSELATIAASLPSGPVTSYCNTGHWASTDWFVLSEVLGRKDVKLFSGSMVEWTANESRPVVSSRTKWDDLKKAFGLGS